MDLAILNTQIATASERNADDFGIRRSDDSAMMKLPDDLGELTKAHLRRTGRTQVAASVAPEALQEAFKDKLADVVGTAMLLASVGQLDLDAALERKWLPWHPERISTHDFAEAAHQARGP